MKKQLLALSFIATVFSAKAQNCSDLIISEYVEGSGNNKAIEIYNTSPNPISLANYRLIRWDNGSLTADQGVEGVLQLPTNITVQPYQAYVIALNLTDPNGTGQSEPISTVLQAAADTLLCPGCATGTGNSRVMCFNGDDAISLQKNVGGTWTNIDIFGCIGERPSNSSGTFSPTAGWTDMAPFSSIPPGYTTTAFGPYFKRNWTLDHTLQRKNSVQTGVATNPAPETFNVTLQWDSLPENTFSGLGAHACVCSVVNVKEITSQNVVKLYPNPSFGVVYIESAQAIQKVQVYAVDGRLIEEIKFENLVSDTKIDLSKFNKGLYFISLMDKNIFQTTKQFIIE
jgi:hypothetical protein